MSYFFNSRSMCSVPSPAGTGSAFPISGNNLATEAFKDDRLDLSLRQVPLPEGFHERLNKLACELSDEPSDQVDYLGC